MNAFFLCAGFGTRMKELTQSIPKPLLPIAGIPLLDISLYWAWKWGVKKGIINTHYQAESIHQHIQNFQGFPLKISHEEGKIRGTGGGIAYGLQNYPEFIDNELWVFNPDTILQPYNEKTILQEIPTPSLCHLYLLPEENHQYTRLYLDSQGYLNFEKTGEKAYYYIGFCRMKPKLLTQIAKDTREYWELTELWRNLAKEKKITGSLFPGNAWDVGTKEAYVQLNHEENPIWMDNQRKKEILSLY